MNYQLSIINYQLFKYKFLGIVAVFWLLSSSNVDARSGFSAMRVYDASTNLVVEANPSTGAFELIKGKSYYFKETIQSEAISESFTTTISLLYDGIGTPCVTVQEDSPNPTRIAACNNCTPRRIVVNNPPYTQPSQPAIDCSLSNAVLNVSNGLCYPEIPCNPITPGRRCFEQTTIFPPPTIYYEYCPIIRKSIDLQVSGTTTDYIKVVQSANFTIPDDAIHGGYSSVKYFQKSAYIYTIDDRFDIYKITTNNTISTTQTTVHTGLSLDVTKISGSLPRGGDGVNYSYQWQKSTDFGANWSLIPDGITRAYTPGIITQSTWFRRIAGVGSTYKQHY